MTALLIGSFTLLFLLGWPVVLSILGPAVVYVLMNDLPIELIGQRMAYAMDSFPLVAVPVFIYVGNLMNQAGVTERIFKFADTLVGRVPGGLAQVNVVASLIFSGMSGAMLADVGGLGRIEVKAMTARGFRKDFSSAVTVASAIVGPIFPPSIPLIIYGSVTNVSIVQLLIAGIVPALICVALLMITVVILALRRGYPRAERWPTLGELWRDFVPAIPAMVTPLMLVSGMLLGIFTPTEAASITVVYVLLITTFVYRTLTLQHLLYAAYETLKSTSAILVIVSVASLFGWIMAIEQIPQMFAQGIALVQQGSGRAPHDRQCDPAHRRHVPRQHHRDAPGHPDHLRTAPRGGCGPCPSRDRRDLQLDDGSSNPADGSCPFPDLRYRQGVDAEPAQGVAALLYPPRRHIVDHHVSTPAGPLAAEDDAVMTLFPQTTEEGD